MDCPADSQMIIYQFDHMNMKSIFNTALAAMAFILAAACSTEGIMERQMPESTISFTISSAAPHTKAGLQTSAEQMMKTLDVFVFFKDGSAAEGQLENYLHVTPNSTSYSGQIKVQQGVKSVVFAANLPSDYPGQIKTLSDYEGLAWSFAQNARDSFVMDVKAEVNVNSASYSMDNVNLVRQVSRVELKKVTSSLPSSYGAVTLVGAWLHNVPKVKGETDYSADAKFWRKTDLDASGNEAVKKMMDPGQALSTGKFTGTLSSGSSWTGNASEPYYAYGYPNTATQAASADAKDHVTKFVIQIKVNGVNYYYPIGIVGMQSNLAYEIESVELTRLGSTDPDKYVSSASLSLSVTVKDWTKGTITGSYNGTVSGDNFVF